ncbi:hypothetical protein XENTR_v10005196 [Xenopus tropicalis]|nr:hypothetical protein XENTR_v10005196 [Xenopus tropicalis]
MSESAANNISCELYDITSMRCYWDFATNAPDDTNYTLLLIQYDSQYQYELQCQHYEHDRQRRAGKCEFHDLRKNVDDKASVILVGNSKENIQIYAKGFYPSHKEIFKPPTNISLLFSENEVTIYWSQPKTIHIAEECFEYRVQDVHGKMKPFDLPDGSSKYTKDISSFEEECPLRMRARGTEACGIDTNWGEWSEELKCRNHGPSFPKDNIIIYTAIATAIILACLVLLLMCMRCFKIIFPPIPHPKKYSVTSKPTYQVNEWDNESLKSIQIIPVLESEEPDGTSMDTQHNPHRADDGMKNIYCN